MKFAAKIISALLYGAAIADQVFEPEAQEQLPEVSESFTKSLADFDRLLAKLNELGGELHKVKLSEVDVGNREMVASENISAGDLIAYIPEDMILDFQEAHSSKAVTQLKENEVYEKLSEKDRDSIALALYLIEQGKESESKWKEYLEILPTDVSNFPLFYENETLDWFKGGELGGYIKAMKSQLEETFRTMASGIHDFRAGYPEEQFQRLYKLIDSRKFSLANEERQFNALIPVVDLFNQGRAPGVESGWKE